MCEGMVLPHWGHLLRCGACQRFAALRVRNRILDVLRFGTPMAGSYQSTSIGENNVEALKR
jgi:hypothetical protein